MTTNNITTLITKSFSDMGEVILKLSENKIDMHILARTGQLNYTFHRDVLVRQMSKRNGWQLMVEEIKNEFKNIPKQQY